jgi:hypothetical protein
MKVLLGELRKEIVAGLQYTHSRANANTSRALESATFLYALIELLTEKGVLTIEELDAQKGKIADRVEKRFLSKGMGVVLQEPDQDKYAFRPKRMSTARTACTPGSALPHDFPASRQDIAKDCHVDLESPI